MQLGDAFADGLRSAFEMERDLGDAARHTPLASGRQRSQQF
jgi:hypothetical protein